MAAIGQQPNGRLTSCRLVAPRQTCNFGVWGRMGRQFRKRSLLASSSLATLLIGFGAPSASAACIQINSTTDNPAATTVAGFCVTNTSFSGSITNEGTISPSGITFSNGTITGGITSTGTIAGGITLDATRPAQPSRSTAQAFPAASPTPARSREAPARASSSAAQPDLPP